MITLALAQHDFLVGDLKGNLRKTLDLVVFVVPSGVGVNKSDERQSRDEHEFPRQRQGVGIYEEL